MSATARRHLWVIRDGTTPPIHQRMLVTPNLAVFAQLEPRPSPGRRAGMVASGRLLCRGSSHGVAGVKRCVRDRQNQKHG